MEERNCDDIDIINEVTGSTSAKITFLVLLPYNTGQGCFSDAKLCVKLPCMLKMKDFKVCFHLVHFTYGMFFQESICRCICCPGCRSGKGDRKYPQHEMFIVKDNAAGNYLNDYFFWNKVRSHKVYLWLYGPSNLKIRFFEEKINITLASTFS